MSLCFLCTQILEALEVDFIDESEVLTPADETYHINKKNFKVRGLKPPTISSFLFFLLTDQVSLSLEQIPFVCGCRNLGEALRRINEGAAMIRTKGEAGTGDVVNAVKHARQVTSEIRKMQNMTEEELFVFAKEIQAPYHLVKETAKLGRLPVVNFAAGGVATPADAAMMMQLGMDGVFVGSVSSAAPPSSFCLMVTGLFLLFFFLSFVFSSFLG